MTSKTAHIVDYGLGNLFSIKNACLKVGLTPTISSLPQDIERADIVILPGVGAFGDAMTSLRLKGLIEPIREVAQSGKPFMGICLGMQLLMTSSEEFGYNQGLNIIPGITSKLQTTYDNDNRPLKVPHIGWNRINTPILKEALEDNKWKNTPLSNIKEGEYMYFVHSYYVIPEDPKVVLSNTTYGQNTFCSSLRMNNIFAVQFHPERSGPSGLKLYAQLNACSKES
ncbi:MAG: imidazole glycerol phosphate synthase subunit HisH [Dehalococcoidia bacterium]|nr:imidazole glycerol phosphate synthase subunit HisH [Dehalococcoidia bacterium]|tara:strand:- start:1655 stop:2332 length:678 start_codon:yes stop_codon:yes gene_type:complete